MSNLPKMGVWGPLRGKETRGGPQRGPIFGTLGKNPFLRYHPAGGHTRGGRSKRGGPPPKKPKQSFYGARTTPPRGGGGGRPPQNFWGAATSTRGRGDSRAVLSQKKRGGCVCNPHHHCGDSAGGRSVDQRGGSP